MTFRSSIGSVLHLLLAVAGLPLLASGPAALTIHVPISRSIAPGESHVYELTLAAGERATVRALQTNADVELCVRTDADVAPAGASPLPPCAIRMDMPSAYNGEERLTLLASSDLRYRIEVRSLEATSRPPGAYELEVVETGRASDADRKRRDAEARFMEGERLRKEGGVANLKTAAESFKVARALWQELGDTVRTGDAAHHAAYALDLLNEFEPARLLYEEALAIRRAAGDARRQGETIANLGSLARATGKLDQALQLLGEALTFQRQAGDAIGEGSTLHTLGTLHWQKGDYVRSTESYTQSLEVRRRAGDRRGESQALVGLGLNARVRGESQQAISFYEQAIAIKREIDDRRGTGQALHNLGVVYSTLGEFQRALDLYDESLALSRSEGDRIFASSTLTSMGIAWKFLGQYDKALEAFQAALDIRPEGYKLGLAEALTSLGLTHEALGHPKQALDHYLRALPLHAEVSDRRGEGHTLSSIAAVYVQLGDREKADEYLRRALELQQSIHDASGEASSLLQLGSLRAAEGKLEEARGLIERSLEYVESARARVPVQSQRASYLALKQDHYQFYIDVLMQQHAKAPGAGHDREAFLASEQAKARSLRELLAEARAGLDGVDPVLRQRREEIEKQLSARERERMRLPAKATPEVREAAKRAVEELVAQHQQIESEIRTAHPRYAALTQQEPLSLEEIQSLLDADTVLIEYALGNERSYGFVVTRDSLRAVRLGARREIETQARKLYELVSGSPRREQEIVIRALARDVARSVIEPLNLPSRTKRIVLVADGALHSVPFSMLPAAAGSTTPLIAQYEIATIPAAAVLATLRSDQKSRLSAKTVAVFADPVLRPDDPRVAATERRSATPAVASADALRSARDAGMSEFVRLPHSSREARAIVALAGEAAAWEAVGFDATREQAMSARLAEYRIVHFATHAFLNNERPQLSGVVLSMVDREGSPRDGFLRLHDIYDLRLGADLVVLSACRTALGREMRGEGLVGISRGFMYAGAPTVIASLWDVRDDTTAELMKRFYAKVLKEKLSPAAALRSAQLTFWKEGKPAFLWAPFVVQGEYRPRIE